MNCDVCGKSGARVRRVARAYGKGASILVIQNVPMVSCPHCGESYVTADTLKQIETIKRNRRRTAVRRPVAVAEFP